MQRETDSHLLTASSYLEGLGGRADDVVAGSVAVAAAFLNAVLERGLHAELTAHLGYERGDPAGRGSPNSRNGTTPKTVGTEVGAIAGPVSSRGWSRRGSAGSAAWTMIISCTPVG